MTNSSKFPKGIELVSSGIAVKDGKILMAKSPKWSNKWTLPGGHIEVGEGILESCAREMEEETGLSVKPIEIINAGELINSKDFHRPAHFVYFDVLLEVQDDNVKLQEEELSDHGWFTLEEALALDLAEDFDNTLLKYKEYLERKNEN